MAQHKSAEKRNRQNEIRGARNSAIRSRTRRAMREARAAAESKAEDAQALIARAIREVNKAASMKVLKKTTAGRYMSRLMRAAN